MLRWAVTFGGPGPYGGQTVKVYAADEWLARQEALKRYGGRVYCRQVGLTY